MIFVPQVARHFERSQDLSTLCDEPCLRTKWMMLRDQLLRLSYQPSFVFSWHQKLGEAGQFLLRGFASLSSWWMAPRRYWSLLLQEMEGISNDILTILRYMTCCKSNHCFIEISFLTFNYGTRKF